MERVTAIKAQRLAEIQTFVMATQQPPPWDSHRWRFVAQDSSGEWWGYNAAPKQTHWGWDKPWSCCRISKGLASNNWRNTLMERP